MTIVRSLINYLNLRTDIIWKLGQMFSPIIRGQENNIVSSTKLMIETHVLDNAVRIIPRDNWKDYNKIPLHNRNNVKANCDINELPEGRFPLTV